MHRLERTSSRLVGKFQYSCLCSRLAKGVKRSRGRPRDQRVRRGEGVIESAA